MKTLIVYGTKYGCTEKCATLLSEKLSGKVDLCNIKGNKDLELSQYDVVIIGGSIYLGKIQREVSEFCAKNIEPLKQKKLGLFICGMRDGEMGEAQIETSFPKELLANAAAKGLFGGEFIFRKMNFIEKAIVRKIAKTNQDVSNILEGNIDGFVQMIKQS